MPTMTAMQAADLGFDIDRNCYPWLAYKGPRFDPYETHSLVTPPWPRDAVQDGSHS